MTVDPNEPRPLYEQVAAALRARIASGELTGRVPSIVSIAQEFGVAKGTAERALTILKDEGTITVVIGRGAFVTRQ